MKITAIKRQVKRLNRYSIYGNGEYLFSYSEAELIQSGIRIGQEIDRARLQELQNRALIDKAYERALNLLSRRMRSEWEMRDYLKRKGSDQETQDIIVGRLKERGYLNDVEFAKRWVENRRLLKPTSNKRLSLELRQKRIHDDIIRGAIESDEKDEVAALIKMVEKKRRQTKYQDDEKLMQYLARQGFSYNLIKSALKANTED